MDRASLHVGTLHPELYGYAWNWNADDGICDEVKVDESVLSTDAYRKNPLLRVVEYGELFRTKMAASEQESPLHAQLAEQGITEYAAIPLTAGAPITTLQRSRRGMRTDSLKNSSRPSPACCGFSRCTSNATAQTGSAKTCSTPISAKPLGGRCCVARSNVGQGSGLRRSPGGRTCEASPVWRAGIAGRPERILRPAGRGRSGA